MKMSDDAFQKGIKYEIFIGLKDKDSYKEILSAENFKEVLADVCREKQISFSLLTQLGGYTHNKGYTTETSLRVIIIGINEEELVQLSMRLKKMINTDTILITRTDIEYSFM